MLNDLSTIIPVSGKSISARPELRPSGGESRAVVAEVLPVASGDALGEPARAKLERLAEAAAKELFPAREVAVESFYDESSGRYVHRIADSESGELLLQTPPDELLRFFASGREPYGAPLLEIDA
jgi:uncharacterized FlaG/YvyC family protein